MAFETGALLQELLATYGPCGEEDAVREVCRRELEPLVDETWVDAAGNLVGLLRGGEPGPGVPAIRVMAHMDELSMVVKRVEDGGRRHMAQLGTMYPANFGLGPVAVLGGRETLTAVLALGSEHTTQETQHGWQVKPDRGDQALDWLHVYVFTGRTADELREAGVHPGTRACIHRSKRTLVRVGPHLGSYFIDDRAALTTVLAAAAAIRETGRRLPATSTSCSRRARRPAGWARRTRATRCPATSRSHWTSGQRKPSTRCASTRDPWSLQGRGRRLRQEHRRPPSPPGRGARRRPDPGRLPVLRVRRLAREGEWAGGAVRADRAAHDEHPRLRGHPRAHDRPVRRPAHRVPPAPCAARAQ